MEKTDPSHNSYQQADHLFREVSGKVVAVLNRQFGAYYLEAVLDAVQEAFEAALVKWRFVGIPQQPEAWLLTVARRKLLNQLRKDKRMISTPSEELSIEETDDPDFSESYVRDSQLDLLLACIQLPLSKRDRIITTLHVLCGFSPAELARAMDVHFEAVRKSLYRNKQKLAADPVWQKRPIDGGEEFKYPSTLLEVLYAMFNEGYKSSKSDHNYDIALCYEAVRLLKLIIEKHHSVECHALLALFYFHLSRFPARLDGEGDWMTLQHQDRSLWDQRLIGAGFYHLERAKPEDQLNTWYLEAVIASLHVMSPSFDQTPWKEIEQLYLKWLTYSGSNVMVQLQALTTAIFYRPDAHLAEELEALRPSMGQNQQYLVDATLAELYDKLGNATKSKQYLSDAIGLCENPRDKRLMEKRMKL